MKNGLVALSAANSNQYSSAQLYTSSHYYVQFESTFSVVTEKPKIIRPFNEYA